MGSSRKARTPTTAAAATAALNKARWEGVVVVGHAGGVRGHQNMSMYLLEAQAPEAPLVRPCRKWGKNLHK
jgi:hypothetical protein